MFICLLLFSLIAQAEDQASERYCFSGPSEAQMAEKKFSGIKVQSDVVSRDENCLVIQMSSHRRELIQRYLLSTFPSAKISFSSAEIKRDPCRLKIEKIRDNQSQDTSIQLSGSSLLEARAQKASGKETLQIQTLKEFELTVDQDQVKGECRFITPTRYEISLEVKKNPKPIYPESLPPGSVIVLNAPPPDQTTATLKTTLQLGIGERIEIGSLVKSLKNDSQEANTQPEVKAEAATQTTAEKVFLSIE